VAACLTVALRLPGLLDGLPYVRHPDEPVNYLVFHEMVATRSALPRFYVYPSLQYLVQGIPHAALLATGRVLGVWDSNDELGLAPNGGVGTTLVMSKAPWLLARSITVAVAVVGVLLVVHLATTLCRSRRWGAFAGTLAAVSGIGVSTGFLITPDALAGTTATATIALLIGLVHRPAGAWFMRQWSPLRWSIVTGLSLGLSVAAKYNNGLLALAVVAAVFLVGRQDRPSLRQVALLLAVAATTFLILNPAVLFDAHEFRRGVDELLGHYSAGHAGAEGGSLRANTKFLWNSDRIAVVLAIAGSVLVRNRTTWLLSGWVVGYTFLVSLSVVHFDRNLTSVLGALAVVAAVGAQRLWVAAAEQWHRDPHRAVRRPLVLACALLLLVPPTVSHTRDTVDALQVHLADPMSETRVWLDEQLPMDSSVLVEAYAPWIGPGRRVTHVVFIAQVPADLIAAHEIIVLTSSASGRFINKRDRYPTEAAVIDVLHANACATRTHVDQFGFRVEVVFQQCP